jgi:hypothetical protein
MCARGVRPQLQLMDVHLVCMHTLVCLHESMQDPPVRLGLWQHGPGSCAPVFLLSAACFSCVSWLRTHATQPLILILAVH